MVTFVDVDVAVGVEPSESICSVGCSYMILFRFDISHHSAQAYKGSMPRIHALPNKGSEVNKMQKLRLCMHVRTHGAQHARLTPPVA